MKYCIFLIIIFLSFFKLNRLSGEQVGVFIPALDKFQIIAVVSKTGKTTFLKGNAKINDNNNLNHLGKLISDQGKEMGGAIVIISQRPANLKSIKVSEKISFFDGKVKGSFDEFCREFGFKSVGLEVGPKIEK